MYEEARIRATGTQKSKGRYSRQRRWHQAHLVTLSTHLPIEAANDFILACKARGTTHYAVLRDAALSFTAEVFGGPS